MEPAVRLSQDQIKQGILHPEPMVRDVAVWYFTRSLSTDPTVMPLVIRDIEARGWEGAFRFPNFLADLAQTEETLLWVIDQLNRMGLPKSQMDLHRCDCLSRMIARADISLVMKHEQRILGLEGFLNEYRQAISERLELTTIDTDTLWEELERFSGQFKGKGYFSEARGRAFRLAEAMARDEACAGRALSILSRSKVNYKTSSMGWMEIAAARIAGEMRLEAALPLLLARLAEDGEEGMNEQCVRALIATGADAAVEAIRSAFPSAPRPFKLNASVCLRGIHSESVVARSLELLESESSPDIRSGLVSAILGNFASEGIEPARQLTLQGAGDLRATLVGVATLMGQSFPELEAWKKEEKAHDETVRRRMEEWSGGELLAKPKPQPGASLPSFNQSTGSLPAAPIAAKKKAGRNDPCPCGSGRKYKKCCMGKDSA
jgi:hypothetical protein